MITIHPPWVFAFGILGNVISFMVFLAPLPTFIRICKKKSTEGFQSFPYVVAIFSCMLWIYYAMLKGNSLLLITINVIGVVIETIYVIIYITYAPRKAKIFTLNILLFMNFGGFCVIVLLCHLLAKGEGRVQAFGWVCVAFSISVFAAPLSIIRTVIRTKSVEYMPFNLSLCLMLTATIWFMYGFVQKDLYITIPNVVGFIFGVVQMILYGFYRKYDAMAKKQKLPEQVQQVVEITSPTKQNNANAKTVEKYNSSINSSQKTKDLIDPQHIINEVEVVISNMDKKSDEPSSISHKDEEGENLNGPPQVMPTTCTVDIEKINRGPDPVSVQLVGCAV